MAATHSANFSVGICHCRVLRGRSFNCRAVALSFVWEWTDKSVPRGKYCSSDVAPSTPDHGTLSK